MENSKEGVKVKPLTFNRILQELDTNNEENITRVTEEGKFPNYSDAKKYIEKEEIGENDNKFLTDDNIKVIHSTKHLRTVKNSTLNKSTDENSDDEAYKVDNKKEEIHSQSFIISTTNNEEENSNNSNICENLSTDNNAENLATKSHVYDNDVEMMEVEYTDISTDYILPKDNEMIYENEVDKELVAEQMNTQQSTFYMEDDNLQSALFPFTTNVKSNIQFPHSPNADLNIKMSELISNDIFKQKTLTSKEDIGIRDFYADNEIQTSNEYNFDKSESKDTNNTKDILNTTNTLTNSTDNISLEKSATDDNLTKLESTVDTNNTKDILNTTNTLTNSAANILLEKSATEDIDNESKSSVDTNNTKDILNTSNTLTNSTDISLEKSATEDNLTKLESTVDTNNTKDILNTTNTLITSAANILVEKSATEDIGTESKALVDNNNAKDILDTTNTLMNSADQILLEKSATEDIGTESKSLVDNNNAKDILDTTNTLMNSADHILLEKSATGDCLNKSNSLVDNNNAKDILDTTNTLMNSTDNMSLAQNSTFVERTVSSITSNVEDHSKKLNNSKLSVLLMSPKELLNELMEDKQEKNICDTTSLNTKSEKINEFERSQEKKQNILNVTINKNEKFNTDEQINEENKTSLFNLAIDQHAELNSEKENSTDMLNFTINQDLKTNFQEDKLKEEEFLVNNEETFVQNSDFTNKTNEDDEFTDADFHNNLILNPADFDYLLTRGNNSVLVNRNSLLLRFDPLLGVPVPKNQAQIQLEDNYLVPKATFIDKRNPILEEDEEEIKESPKHKQPKKNARMSVEVINDIQLDAKDTIKSFDITNTETEDKEHNFKMDNLEKKIKNEVLKTEDIEKKLKEAEQREEALIKRITEKDKMLNKVNGVIEAYEKAIAELIAEKEQLVQNHEKQLNEVKADRDSNYRHLTSLETTFSDLHVKYEKSKEMTQQLQTSLEVLQQEKIQNLENLRLQEQRYVKMKHHAMQQLEIANKKLESLSKDHAVESTKLKALLKKEEISRASISEQLVQKVRENEELVKICDELINGQGS